MSIPNSKFILCQHGRLSKLTVLITILLSPVVKSAADEQADWAGRSANISVTATAESECRDSSALVGFTVTISNAGPDHAKKILLEMVGQPDVLARLNNRRISASEGIHCQDEILACEVGSLAADESVEVHLLAEFAASLPATVGLEFRISSETHDTTAFDNHYYSAIVLPIVGHKIRVGKKCANKLIGALN